jgi:Spy/CpxP family protein refolding chaperone
MLRKLLMAGLLCASLAMAQGGGRGRGGGTGEMDPRAGGPPSSNRFENIANFLSLNKDQRKTVRTILDEDAKEAAPIREQMSKSRIAVGEAIVANKSEAELKQVAKTASDLDVQISQIEIKAFVHTYAALDPIQKKDMRGLGQALALMNGMYHIKNWTEE